MNTAPASRTPRAFSRWLAVALAAITAPCAGAQDAPRPDTSAWKCGRCPFARGYQADYELGAGYVSEDAARFGNATGHDEKGGHAVAAGTGRYVSGSYLMQWDLVDLGLDARAVELTGGEPGAYEYRLGYSELPYRRFDTTETIFRRAGESALALPSGWVPGGTTDGFTALGASLIDRDIGRDRQSFELGGEFGGMDGLRLRASYRRTQRDGWSVVGASFFNSAALLAAPFEDRTDTVDFAARYDRERWFLELSGSGSFYDNSNREWRWDNPYLSAASAAQGTLAQSPDNDAQSITLSGAFHFAQQTTLGWSASAGEVRQDERLLAYSINPGLPAAALPRASLDGKLDTTHVDLRITSRPWPFVRLKGLYRYDDRDNNSPVALWSRTITDLFPSDEPAANRPYSFERTRLGLSAAARFDWFDWLRAFELEAGYDRFEVDRDLQEAAEQSEDQSWGRVRWRTDAGVEVSLRGGASRRDIDRYDPAVAAASEQNPLLRKYTLAYRFRDFAELRTTIGWPGRPITFGGELFYASDDYTESPLGLSKSDDRRFAADLTWAFSEQASAYLSGGYEDIESRIAGSEAFAAADWSSQHRDRFRTLGAGLDLEELAKRFDVRVNLTYGKGLGGIDVASTRSGGGAYPRLETELKSASVDVDYRLTESMDLRLRLRYEDFSSPDWALAGVAPATIPSVLTLGAAPYDYDVYLAALSIRYWFGRPAAGATQAAQSESNE